MAAVDPSIYEEIVIESADHSRSVDIKEGVVAIDYYEDIFSPTITAKLTVYNTGNTVENQTGEMQAIYNGLPLRGGERVSLKIKGNHAGNPGLDFSTNQEDYLYVSGISNVISKTQEESFILNLTSRESITNETSRVGRKFPPTLQISESADIILREYLVTNKEIEIDTTQNTYGFIGNMRKPFTVLTWLAAKSVPESSSEDGTAGFLFFQTKDAYKFKSIDDLISQEPKQLYTYTEVSRREDDHDHNILSYTTEVNENIIEKLRLGAYASNRIFYNPLNFTFPTKTFKLDDYAGNSRNLGREIDLPALEEGSQETLGDLPSRVITQILDVGTFEVGISTATNADPMQYQSQALMRYNTLFTQTLSMIIPSNTNLTAGDIIECQFPLATTSGANEYDRDQSGLYMIKELCHHFSPDGSWTSMRIIRDTFGRYGRNT